MLTALTILTTGNMSGQAPTTGAGRFVAYTSEYTTEARATSVTRTNTISATSDQTLRSSERTIYTLITTASREAETLMVTDATLTTTAETSRFSTNQTARITEATSKALSTTHSRANTIETPYAERNASISLASSYVSTASSLDVTDVTSTTRHVDNTTATGQNLGWQPVHSGILGGAVCILVLVVAIILCAQRRKKLKLKKSSGSDAWISKPGSSGVALADLTFNPPLDLEKAVVDGDISTLDGLANAPAVNIFATNYGSFEADTSPSKTHVNRRATLNSQKQSDGGSTPEKKGKGLTPAEIPVVSTSKTPSIGGASPKSETRLPTSFGSTSNSGADSASTANIDTPSVRNNGNPRVAPLPPEASASPPAAPAPLTLVTPNQTTVSPPPPGPADPLLQTDLTVL